MDWFISSRWKITTLEWSDGTPVDYPGSLYDGHRQYFYYRSWGNKEQWAGTNNLDDSSPDGGIYKRLISIDDPSQNILQSTYIDSTSLTLKFDTQNIKTAIEIYGNAFVGDNDTSTMLTWVPGTPGSSLEDYEYAFKSGYVNHQDVGYFGGDNFYRFLYQARHLGGDLASIHSQEENDFIMNLIGGTGYWYKSYFGFWRPNGVVNGPWEWTDGTAVTFNAMPASENDNNAHYANCGSLNTMEN